MTNDEIRDLIKLAIKAIDDKDDDAMGSTAHQLADAIRNMDIENMTCVAISEAIDEDDNDMARDHFENALEFLDAGE